MVLYHLLAVLATVSADELLDVTLFTRHGSRTPLHYPPYDEHPWDRGINAVGQLTQAGSLQHHVLGTKLRERYVDELGFISPTYNLDEFDNRTTFCDRTNMSAYSLLTGMFPLLPEEDVCDPALRRQYFQPFVASRSNDVILKGNQVCDIYPYYMTHGLQETQDFKDFMSAGNALYEEANKCFGYDDISVHNDIMEYYDPLICGLKEFGTYPNDRCSREEWDAFLPRFIDVYIQYNAVTVPNGNEYVQTAQIPLFVDMVYNFRSAIKKDKRAAAVNKFHYYSTHDTNVLMLLAGLGVWDEYYIPPFATHIVFELWHSDQFGYYVSWKVNEYIDDVLAATDVTGIDGENSQKLMYFETPFLVIHSEIEECVIAARELGMPGAYLGTHENPNTEMPGCPYTAFVQYMMGKIRLPEGVGLPDLESNDYNGNSEFVVKSFIDACSVDPNLVNPYSWVVPTAASIIGCCCLAIITMVVVFFTTRGRKELKSKALLNSESNSASETADVTESRSI